MAIAREQALVRLPNKASTDLTGKEGYAAVYDSGLALAATANLANTLGVITNGGAAETDIAVCGAYGGVVRVKVAGSVTCGAKLAVGNGGTFTAYTSGAGTVVAVALQDGSADELVEAALLTPITFAA